MITKEQAEYIIKRLQNIPLAATTYDHDVWHCDDIIESINNCITCDIGPLDDEGTPIE